MHNVIEFPRTASQTSRPVPEVDGSSGAVGAAVTQELATGSIGNMIGALSRTLEQIGMMCELISDGPIRAQLEAERSRLLAGLAAARQTAARLPSAGVAAPSPGASEPPLAVTN